MSVILILFPLLITDDVFLLETMEHLCGHVLHMAEVSNHSPDICKFIALMLRFDETVFKPARQLMEKGDVKAAAPTTKVRRTFDSYLLQAIVATVTDRNFWTVLQKAKQFFLRLHKFFSERFQDIRIHFTSSPYAINLLADEVSREP